MNENTNELFALHQVLHLFQGDTRQPDFSIFGKTPELEVDAKQPEEVVQTPVSNVITQENDEVAQ